MKLYSYVLEKDAGAAPNPFYGHCTLAICKPAIRRNAHFGDWVVGTGNSKTGNDKLIYAMKVTEVMDFKNYFNDKRFEKKKPIFDNRDEYCHLGDNIYQPTADGFNQLPSVHSKGSEENLKNKLHDLGEKLENNRVLISDNFYYFGNHAVALPNTLHSIIKKGRAHKFTSINRKEIEEFENFISSFEKGINGEPNDLLTSKNILDIPCIKFNKCCED